MRKGAVFLFSILFCLSAFGFSAEPLKLVVFNIQKMENSKWDEVAFQDLSNKADFVVLQEALNRDMSFRCDQEWTFYKSWENSDYQTGLGTLARFKAVEAEVLFSPTNEPISNTPKISVVETYHLSGVSLPLMVVNTHGINFRGFSHFRRQMNAVYDFVKNHEGPMIWAGDFNTRNSSRKKYLIEVASKLNLKEVDFGERSKKGFALDRVFTRGLIIEQAFERVLKISDHEPLVLDFHFQ